MNQERKYAVIFDMDGVIINSNPFHKIALKEFCKKYGYDLTEEQLFQKIYGRTNKEWITNIFGEISQEQLAMYAEEKEGLFRKIYADAIEALKGIKNFIQILDDNQIPKAIGTSAPRANVDFVLEKTGLGGYFQTILDESHVSKGKPNPEIYLKVAEALAFEPQNCVVFEDSISGVQAGKAAGCKVVGVLTTHSEEELDEADAFIDDFEDLDLNMLDSLF